MTSSLTLVVPSLILLASGCASATVVKRSADGGRVQLSGPYMFSMSDAKLLMAEQCDGHFQSIERGDQLEFHCDNAAPTLLAEAPAR